jgi:3-oxoacyl-[acyl-carrier-protein] synthase-3
LLNIKVAGVGSVVPRTGTENAEMEARLGLESGWIEKRTGVRFRPIAEDTVATSDLAVSAGQRALEAACVLPAEIGLLLLATSTPDHLLPPTAPLVAHRLALTNAGAIDMAGACSGFLYAFLMGASFAQTMQKPVLVIAANILSRRVDPMDRNTVTLFGDGAGAVALVPSGSDAPHVLGTHLAADGSQYDAMGIPAGGTREPLTAAGLHAGRHRMMLRDGKGLFKQAAGMMAEAGRRALMEANLGVEDIDWWIPHQANLRMIRETGRILAIPSERTVTVMDRYANSSAATIPIALAEAVADGRIGKGDTLLLTAAGAGMMSAGIVLRW